MHHYRRRRLRRERWSSWCWCLVFLFFFVFVEWWFSIKFFARGLASFNIRTFALCISRLFIIHLLGCTTTCRYIFHVCFITHHTDNYEKCESDPSLLLFFILIIFLEWVDVIPHSRTFWFFVCSRCWNIYHRILHTRYTLYYVRSSYTIRRSLTFINY